MRHTENVEHGIEEIGIGVGEEIKDFVSHVDGLHESKYKEQHNSHLRFVSHAVPQIPKTQNIKSSLFIVRTEYWDVNTIDRYVINIRMWI